MSTTIWGDWTQEVAWGRFDMGTFLIAVDESGRAKSLGFGRIHGSTHREMQ